MRWPKGAERATTEAPDDDLLWQRLGAACRAGPRARSERSTRSKSDTARPDRIRKGVGSEIRRALACRGPD